MIELFSQQIFDIYEFEKKLNLPEYTILSFLSFVLGPIFAVLINLSNRKINFEKNAIYKSENWLEILFRESAENGVLIEVTLDTGKIYVGWIIRTTDPRFNRQYFQMHILISGYRDNKQKIVFTTNYADVYEKLKQDEKNEFRIEDFITIISISSLISARPFDYGLYELFEDLN